MSGECGDIDIRPIVRLLEKISREQQEQRRAIQLLGKAILKGGGGNEGGFQNVSDLDVRPLLGIPDKVRADLQNQNATLQMMRKDIWTISNKVTALDNKMTSRLAKMQSEIISRLAEFIRTYFGQLRTRIENTERMVVTIGNRTQELRKFANDTLFGVNQANIKLNNLGNLSGLREMINNILFGTNQANIKLNSLMTASQALSTAIGAIARTLTANHQTTIATINTSARDTAQTINTNVNGVPGRVINPLTATMRDNTLTINSNVNNNSSRVIGEISNRLTPIANGVNTIINLIKGLPGVKMVDDLAQRIITQLSAVAQQNTRTIVDRIIGLPIPEMQKVLQLVFNSVTEMNPLVKDTRDLVSRMYAILDKRTLRIYNLLGGNRFFPNDSDVPQLSFNPEGDVKFYGSRMFNADGTSKNLTIGSIPDFISAIQAANFYRSGLHRLPAKVPERIHLKDGQQEKERTISTSLDFSLWQFQQLDSAVGMYPLRIKYKDANGQEKKLEIDNIAEGMSEIIGLMLSLDSDTDLISEVQLKTVGEVIQNKAALSLINDYVVAISDFLGFKYDIGERKMPIPINPKATNIKGFLESSQQSIQKVEIREPDTNDISSKLNQLIILSSMAKAALTRKGDLNKLEGDEIREEVEKVDDEWTEFKSFINNYPTTLRQPGQPKPHLDDRTAVIMDETQNQ